MTAHATYRYRAFRQSGAVEQGELLALSREEVVQSLTDRGLFVAELEAGPGPSRTAREMSWTELALGLRQLANLLQAGLPMDRVLAAFGDSAPGGWRGTLETIREDVGQGLSLGAAMGRADAAIPDVIASMVRAGEAGGGAASALARAAALAESVAATRAAVREALTYPAILFAAGSLSLAFLAGVVLPRFAAILADLGQSLPVSTRLVLVAGALARTAALPATLGAIVLLILGRRVITTAEGRRRWHRALLDLPLLGGVRRSLATARAAGAIGALLDSGVPLPQALTLGAAAAGDRAIEAALLEAREAIVQGRRVAPALAAVAALTPTALRLVATGEESGRIAAMFHEASRLEQATAERRVRAAVHFVEPGLILVFGALVALLAAALLQALYGMRPT